MQKYNWEVVKKEICEETREVINEYLRSLQADKKSPQTIRSQRFLLTRFFMTCKKPIGNITSDYVSEWLQEEFKNNKRVSIITKRVCLKSFFKYCKAKGHTNRTLIKDLRLSNEDYWLVSSEKICEQTRKVINEFLMGLKVSQLARATVRGYKIYLQEFFVTCQKPLKQLTPDDVLSHILTRYKGCTEGTVERVLSILANFFKYCEIEGYIEGPLTKSRWHPRIPKSVPKYLESDEYARVKIKAEKLTLRDRTITEFLFSSGCRCKELSDLNVEDIDLDNRTAVVLGKGGKIRTVHFTEECALLLKKLLKEHPKNHPALFLNRFGTRLGVGGIRYVMKKLGIESELSGKLHPHRTRHSFATRLLSKGADLLFIATELGHSDINTTRIYARILPEDLVKQYRRYMG